MSILTRPSQRDMRILAATMDAEAGGEPNDGLVAVAQVVANRAGNPRHPWQAGAKPYMGVIEATCMACVPGQPYGQFSCWNGDRPALLARYFVGGDPDNGWHDESTARRARNLLRLFIDGNFPVVPGIELCTHYYNPALADPKWSNGGAGIKIERHLFLRPDELTPPERGIFPVEPRPVRFQRQRTWWEKAREAWGAAKAFWAGTGLTVGGLGAWIAANLFPPLKSVGDAVGRLLARARDVPPSYIVLGVALAVAAYLILTEKETDHDRRRYRSAKGHRTGGAQPVARCDDPDGVRPGDDVLAIPPQRRLDPLPPADHGSRWRV